MASTLLTAGILPGIVFLFVFFFHCYTKKQPTELLTFYRHEDGMADYTLLKNRMEYRKNKITTFIGASADQKYI
jgi:hypothetical protein